MITEGGNAVKDVSRINRANVEGTLQSVFSKVLPLLGISKDRVAVLGSAGKKDTSGDLDVGIGEVYDIRKFLSNAKSKLDAAGIENNTNFGLKEVSIRWPIENSDGKQPGEFVQVDLMPSQNIDMLKWGMTVPDKKYKGIVRNFLICSIAGFVDRKTLETEIIDGEKVPVVFEKYVLSTTEGLFRKTYSIRGKKPGTIITTKKIVSEKFITDDVSKIVKILFGPSAKPEDFTTVDGLWEQFKKTKAYKDSEIREK